MKRARIIITTPGIDAHQMEAVGALIDQLPAGSVIRVRNADLRRTLRWAAVLAVTIVFWVIVVTYAWRCIAL